MSGGPADGFEDLTWPEAARRSTSGDVLLIPLGSTEQHGPHLPLTTDTDIAVAVATRAAGRSPQLVVAPALAYGSSGEHQGFVGTLSIGQDALESALVELGRSATADFNQVIMVSAHGGNAEPLSRSVARLRSEGRPVTAWTPSWPGDLHAGRTETSLMLAIDPARVRVERAESGDRRPLTALLPLLRTRGVRAVSGNGVLGDPAGANAVEGGHLLALAVEQLIALADHLTGSGTGALPREVAG